MEDDRLPKKVMWWTPQGTSGEEDREEFGLWEWKTKWKDATYPKTLGTTEDNGD